MQKHSIPLYDLKLSKAAIREVNAVLSSGWLATGPKVEALERAMARITGSRYAAAVSSATAGLELTLAAISKEPGREVITTPFTFIATIEAILRAGLKPVFADIAPATLNVDPDEVARKITPRTLCVMPVDIAGQLADYDELRKVCRRKDVPVVADAAHSLGSSCNGRSAAQLADAAVYSFHATKNVTAGEGGMVVSRHKPLIDHIRLLSCHAMTSIAYQRRRSGRRDYDVGDLGHKANLSDLHAAVALGQLSVLEKNQTRRARLARRYMKLLSGLRDYVEAPPEEKSCCYAWHLFIIRLHLSRLHISRDRFISLMAEAGVECGVHFKPIFELSYYRKLGYSAKHFPNAAYAGRRVVSLPMYPELKLGDIDRVCGRIEQIVTRYGR
jgi:UDP-4-amino-4-deoxy-L-arabinose-oxoglutarate aminotransferase